MSDLLSVARRLIGTMPGERPSLSRFILFAVLVQAIPGVLSSTNVFILDLALAYAVAAIGLNVILGLGGLVSIAQASVMALGAYAFTIALGHHMSTPLCALIAAISGSLLSMAMGLLGSRLKTHYFILASLVFAEVTLLLINNSTGLTGGANGLPVIGDGLATTLSDPSTFLRVGFVVVLLVAYLADALRSSRFGLAMSAVTMNEVTGLASGVSPLSTQVVATTVGGFFGAIAGAMLALLDGYIGPSDFGLDTAALLLVIVVVGGRARSGSIVMAAIALTYLSHGLASFQGYGQLTYGVGLIALLIFAPNGIYGIAAQLRSRLTRTFTPTVREVL